MANSSTNSTHNQRNDSCRADSNNGCSCCCGSQNSCCAKSFESQLFTELAQLSEQAFLAGVGFLVNRREVFADLVEAGRVHCEKSSSLGAAARRVATRLYEQHVDANTANKTQTEAKAQSSPQQSVENQSEQQDSAPPLHQEHPKVDFATLQGTELGFAPVEMTVKELLGELDQLTPAQLQVLNIVETSTKKRSSLLKEIDKRLKTQR